MRNTTGNLPRTQIHVPSNATWQGALRPRHDAVDIPSPPDRRCGYPTQLRTAGAAASEQEGTRHWRGSSRREAAARDQPARRPSSPASMPARASGSRHGQSRNARRFQASAAPPERVSDSLTNEVRCGGSLKPPCPTSIFRRSMNDSLCAASAHLRRTWARSRCRIAPVLAAPPLTHLGEHFELRTLS